MLHNGVCAYTRQVGCKHEEEKFWPELDSMLMQARYVGRYEEVLGMIGMNMSRGWQNWLPRVECQAVVDECR